MLLKQVRNQVLAWCAANDIPVQSVYAWLKKARLKQLSPTTSTQSVMLEYIITKLYKLEEES